MSRKLLFLSLNVLFAVVSAFSQEADPATSSNLTSVSLPANAQRIRPARIPEEISSTLEKLASAGEGKLRQGDSEVLAWADVNYSKAKATMIVNRLTDTLKVAGWKYEVGGESDGITVFSLLKEGGNRRALIGFYGATDDALIVAWTELLPRDSKSSAEQVVDNTEVSGSIVGSWDNGRVSMVTRQNTITGATTPGSGIRFEYQFTANGKFFFTGLATTTNYSCSDTLYNEKAGSYTLNGSTLTLNPTKNFWRKTSSCGGGSERNYTLAKETYQFSTKTDEYGKQLICLANSNGESCYRRKEK
jgi:hypothetical protein